MSKIDFRSIGRDWLQKENSDHIDGGRGLIENSIRFSSVKMVVVGDVTWTPIGQLEDFQGGARKVNFTASKNDDDMDACVQTTKDTENVFKIKLTKGIIKGFNSTMKLPLKGTGHEKELGDFLIFDPSKSEPEILKDKMTLSVSVSKRYGSAGASAHVCCREKEYKASFTCYVAVTGRMLVTSSEGGTFQHSIVEIIKDMKEADAEKFSMLEISPTNEVYIKMAGEVELRWEYEQNMHVQ